MRLTIPGRDGSYYVRSSEEAAHVLVAEAGGNEEDVQLLTAIFDRHPSRRCACQEVGR